MSGEPTNRSLSCEEQALVTWMLQHGQPDAANYLSQLKHVKVSPWRCPCGCASLDFVMDGAASVDSGLTVLADFEFGEGDELSGIIVFAKGGMLRGVEVYGLTGDAPKTLPIVETLRPFVPSDT